MTCHFPGSEDTCTCYAKGVHDTMAGLRALVGASTALLGSPTPRARLLRKALHKR